METLQPTHVVPPRPHSWFARKSLPFVSRSEYITLSLGIVTWHAGDGVVLRNASLNHSGCGPNVLNFKVLCAMWENKGDSIPEWTMCRHPSAFHLHRIIRKEAPKSRCLKLQNPEIHLQHPADGSRSWCLWNQALALSGFVRQGWAISNVILVEIKWKQCVNDWSRLRWCCFKIYQIVN